MPLPPPPLDTRRYQELLDEALARIPVHNPEWTNFQPSDPGVTLVEVFAFLTESLLYRCNQVPERNRRAFLSLLGVPLHAGASARGIVSFSNDRGPRAAILLTAGLEVRAGEVPFRTEQGLDVLPIEARGFVKRPLPNPPERVRDYYRQLYASFRGQPPADNLRLYETLPFPPKDTDAPAAEPLQAIDGSIWIALLVRPSDASADPDEMKDVKREVREQLAGRTLSLGLVPFVADASRRLRPGGPAAAGAPAALRFEMPSIPAGGALPTRLAERVPKYRALEGRTGTDLLAEPGVVQLTLPDAQALTLWTNLDPLESGAADFPPALEDTALGSRLITWLRIRSTATLPSQIKWAGINAAMVAQRAHVAGEVLPDGTGEPDQSSALARPPIVDGSVRVKVAVGGAASEWTAIDDLMNAGPEVPVQDAKDPPGTPPPPPRPSQVFSVNRESGEIRFGDGLRGARPPAGAVLRADYDYSVGRRGNVGARAINSGPALPAGVKVVNPERTWGGADPERTEEGEKQVARHLQHRDRLVTAADFEAIVLRTPGAEVGRVDVIPAYNPELAQNEPGDAPGAVTVMVIPRTDPLQPDAPRPDRFFLNAICSYLDPRRLITTDLIVRGPSYKPIWVSVGMTPVAGMSVAEVSEAVRRSLFEFLSPLPAGGLQLLDDLATVLRAPQYAERRRGWPLRTAVVALELQAVASRVPGVLFTNGVLLAEGTNAAGARVPMRGLELPRVAGISVAVGDPVSLDQVRGQSAPPVEVGDFVPVPLIPEEC